MNLDTIFQIPLCAKNLIDFPIGSIVIDKYSNNNYEVLEHTKRGMAKIRSLKSGNIEEWNSCNNRYFYPSGYITTAVICLIEH